MTAKETRLKVIDGAGESSERPKRAPVAVVTGAGRGIGRALVDVLYNRGYDVIAVVRSLNDVRDIFSVDPNRIFPVRCDVEEPSTETVLSEFIETQTGRVDLLFNNAGFGASGMGIDGLDYRELDRVLNVHCYGAIRCVRACMPYLRQSESATIVNISSRFGSLDWVASGVVPHDQATYPYRIAKAALNMFSSCLSIELKEERIKVLAIDPGKVKTRFGPVDADIEPVDSARAIVDLVEKNTGTGLFLNVSGDSLPW
ncbi:MAG: SDR family NAD(P)-dependent oxidoreductase [Candidatus Obscuribacterales bacterium]